MRSARTRWKYVSSRRVTQLARPSHGVFRIVCKAVTLPGPRRHPNRVTGARSPVGVGHRSFQSDLTSANRATHSEASRRKKPYSGRLVSFALWGARQGISAMSPDTARGGFPPVGVRKIRLAA